MNTTRINLWATPRNVSTALMYSFAQRPDTRVVDEPLYGHYLKDGGFDHPGREEILASMETDGEKVIQNLILGPCEQPVLFLKQMTHHLVGLSRDFLSKTHNVLLIRDPKELILSYSKVIEKPVMENIGLQRQYDFYHYLCQHHVPPPVLDATQLLMSPEKTLSNLCGLLGIPFHPSMLQWNAGARPEDGIWAKYWYDNVHRSTGFEPYRERHEPLPGHLMPLYEEARGLYEFLLGKTF